MTRAVSVLGVCMLWAVCAGLVVACVCGAFGGRLALCGLWIDSQGRGSTKA